MEVGAFDRRFHNGVAMLLDVDLSLGKIGHAANTIVDTKAGAATRGERHDGHLPVFLMHGLP